MEIYVVSEMQLYRHQEEGVAFLKSQPKHALLWDEQRVGKTPQAIVASGELGLKKVLVVTPVSGVGVWRHQWKQWDKWHRTPMIVPWSRMSNGGFAIPEHGMCDLVVLDEGHYAKSFGAERTRSVYGQLHGARLIQDRALIPHARHVWHLTGTPAPHDPSDLFPTLLALFPQVLQAHDGYPDVTTLEKFRTRYCVTKLIKRGAHWIKVVIRGQNEAELNLRLKGLFLRRRQKDVGIRPAFWDMLPIEIGDTERRKLFAAIDHDHLQRIVNNRALAEIEPMLAPVRRITGVVKAKAMVPFVEEYLDDNPSEKLVLFYWHRDVGDLLVEKLSRYLPARVDGAVTGDERSNLVRFFGANEKCRLFLGQIAASGEAIDLSAAY